MSNPQHRSVTAALPEPLPDGHPLCTAPHILITPHSADTPAMTAPLLAERIRADVAVFVDAGAGW